MPGIGTAWWMGIGGATLGVLLILAVLHFGFHVFRRRHKSPHREGEGANQSRVEVLESTPIDAERRLVLVRCDGVEHLIMIGGPADVVVENDVKKVRGGGSYVPSRASIVEAEKRASRTTPEPPASTATTAPAQKASETTRPQPARPTPERTAATSSTRSSLAAVPSKTPPRSTSRDQPSSAGKQEEPVWSRASTPRPVADTPARREPSPPRRATPQPAAAQHAARAPEPLRAPSGTLGAGRISRGSSRTAEEPVGLPAAQIPWSDPDSIENEIVRALKFDPQIRGNEPASTRRDAPAGPPKADSSSTTLGDLADRLEEALAREVQSARKVDVELDEFRFESEEPARASPAKERSDDKDRSDRERTEKRERSETRSSTTAPHADAESKREPEPRRETATSSGDRREETPVISLNARRRENVDALEDEMARLLGELTDTKSR